MSARFRLRYRKYSSACYYNGISINSYDHLKIFLIALRWHYLFTPCCVPATPAFWTTHYWRLSEWWLSRVHHNTASNWAYNYLCRIYICLFLGCHEGTIWRIFAQDKVGLKSSKINFVDEREKNPVLEILNKYCGDWTMEKLYNAIAESGAKVIADEYLWTK